MNEEISISAVEIVQPFYYYTVQPNPLLYKDHHPIPSEVFLLIEVSDATLKFDREVKAPAYARSGIAEYWVLDVNARKLHVYRVSGADGY